MRHLNNGTDHRHSKSCCDQSSPARRTINKREAGDLRCHHAHYDVIVMYCLKDKHVDGGYCQFTRKRNPLEIHGCLLHTVACSTVATEALAISINSAGQISLILDQYNTDILHFEWITLDNKITWCSTVYAFCCITVFWYKFYWCFQWIWFNQYVDIDNLMHDNPSFD